MVSIKGVRITSTRLRTCLKLYRYGSSFNDGKSIDLLQEIFVINTLRTLKIPFEASSQTCSAMITTIYRPDLKP